CTAPCRNRAGWAGATGRTSCSCCGRWRTGACATSAAPLGPEPALLAGSAGARRALAPRFHGVLARQQRRERGDVVRQLVLLLDLRTGGVDDVVDEDRVVAQPLD